MANVSSDSGWASPHSSDTGLLPSPLRAGPIQRPVDEYVDAPPRRSDEQGNTQPETERSAMISQPTSEATWARGCRLRFFDRAGVAGGQEALDFAADMRGDVQAEAGGDSRFQSELKFRIEREELVFTEAADANDFARADRAGDSYDLDVDAPPRRSDERGNTQPESELKLVTLGAHQRSGLVRPNQRRACAWFGWRVVIRSTT